MNVPPETARAMAGALDAAVSALERGRTKTAAEHLEVADRLIPNDLDVLQLKGAVALADRDFAGAVQVLGKALKRDPKNPAILNNIAEAYRELGEPRKALIQLNAALKLAPGQWRILFNLGNVQRDLGNFETALELFFRANAANGEVVEPLVNLAVLAEQMGRLGEAQAGYIHALRLRPRDEQLHLGLAGIRQRMRRYDEALESCEAALKLNPKYVDAIASMALVLHQAGRTEEGIEKARAAAEIEPANGGPALQLGRIYSEIGRFDEAEANLRLALQREPALTGAWYALAEINRIDPGRDFAVMEARLGDPSLGPAERANLHFALARGRERAGEPAAAFKHYRDGNDLYGQLEPFDAKRFEAEFATAREVYTPEFFARKSGLTHVTEGPIFIVGMPRSGTSLVEQILASHPDVFGAGELYEMGRIAASIVEQLGGKELRPEAVVDLDAQLAQGYADAYLEVTAQLSGGARFVTDKMPANFLNLGLIALLLPGAKIVHCRRDPMDVGLSCYTQYFETGQAFSSDLKSIATYYREYRRLMAHWAKVLPLDIHEVGYEALIADPEPNIRALLEACGLDWNDACLEFHSTERTVNTASKWQARQPLFASSVGRWKRFEKELAPLTRAVAKVDKEFAAP